MKRVCYGLAIPGLCITCVLFTHLAAKAVFVRLMRKSRHLAANTWQHWAAWIGCVATNTTLSFIIAEGMFYVFLERLGFFSSFLTSSNSLL
jgi:hypothetical protein